MFTIKNKDKIECTSKVDFKKDIEFPKFKALRFVALLSLGMNVVLFLCLWILEARVSKLEQKHYNNTPLEINFGREQHSYYMKPKFSVGQTVVIIKSVVFHLDNHITRSGEIGTILEIDIVKVDNCGTVIFDYIVMIADRTLFFYEDELAAYPQKEDE